MLLDRIRDPAVHFARASLDALEASIRRNIDRILATRQQSARCAPDYGLPDLEDVVQDLERGARALVDRVAEVIARFEPRVTNVRVRRLAEDEPGFEPLVIGLAIKAKIVGLRGQRDSRFRATVTGEGGVRVSEEEP